MSVTKIPVDGLSGGEGILSAAYTGVLETNATFVDQAIFGPSVDGKSWNGKWSVASLYSSLMLVTIEDAGADTQVNIWDLTEVSSGAPSTTPLGTVTLSGDATPTSVAACMGYIIVGSEDGISIIDPHSGSWAERTVGWPRSLSTSTTPALNDNSVQSVTAGISRGFVRDPLTGGPIPVFAGTYGSGSDIYWYMSGTGNFETSGGTAIAIKGVAFAQDRLYHSDQTDRVLIGSELELDDDAFYNQGLAWGDAISPYALIPDNGMSSRGNMLAVASADGLSFVRSKIQPNQTKSLTSVITRAYNTGYMVGDIRGAWLANSATADRSYKSNDLTETGTITAAAVASGAELQGYSGFSTSNYLRRAHDTDLDFGTASFSISMWFKTSASSAVEYLVHIARPSAGDTDGKIELYLDSSGFITWYLHNSTGGGAADHIDSPDIVDDGVWHHVVAVRDSTADRLYLYLDGRISNTDVGPLTSSTMTDSSSTLNIGIGANDTYPATNGTYSLVRISATAPTATQVRQMYEAEKGMFVASAECLLQSGSTDAVLDVDVDPLTGKVLVTQTDAITVFSGLAVDSKPTVNAGASEKGKLWGDLRAEQNSANAYVTAPAVDQRQVNEMVRGLASDLPAGVDLGKAKAWINQGSNTSTALINYSYNIKSVSRVSQGVYDVTFATPFKSDKPGSGSTSSVNWVGIVTGSYYNLASFDDSEECTRFVARILMEYDDGTSYDSSFMAVFFGELENE